jgi:hypothetical protein
VELGGDKKNLTPPTKKKKMSTLVTFSGGSGVNFYRVTWKKNI